MIQQHRDPLAGTGRAPHTRLKSGPIAIGPSTSPDFEAAVTAGGGEVRELDDSTRGLVWLSEKRASDLADVLRAHPGIGWVQLPWAGVDAFAELFATLREGSGPVFTSAKGAYAEPVAEHAVTLAQAVLRELAPKARHARWAERRTGLSLYGRRVVVVGAGGVAVEILRLLAPYRVHVTVVRRTAEPLPGADATVTVDALHDVLPNAEVLILAAAATTASRHLIGARELALLPAGAALVNIARGPLVDTEALTASLAEGHLAGAALDVTDPEPLPAEHALWREPRCLITSHSADTPEMTEPLLAQRVTENVRAFLGDGRLVGIVDPAAGY
jgi:phosphoglycerate dehydrogenase-like enzyme